MTSEAIDTFKELYGAYKTSQSFQDREKQKIITPIFREIIWETIQHVPLTNNHLTGLIQMFGWRSTPANFYKYMNICVQDEQRREELIAKWEAIGERGFTNVGKAAIKKLAPQHLNRIREFLLQAFAAETIDQAESVCHAFELLNIPQVKVGVFSPWLFYINPTLFPLVNNSHNNFQKYFKLAKTYTENIREYHALKDAVGDKDFACIDSMAHAFTADGQLNFRKYLHLNGKRIFKISHGLFSKKYPHSGLWEQLEENNWICMHQDTGKKQGEYFANDLAIGDFIYLCYGGEEVGMIGEIIADAKPLPDEMKQAINRPEEPWLYREVKVLYQPKNKWLDKGMKQFRYAYMPSANWTFAQIPNDDIGWVNEKLFIPYYNVEVLNDDETNEAEEGQTSVIIKTTNIMDPQNLILYGPPGTGKTYASITHAVAIIEGTDFETVSEELREEVRRRFEHYVAEGQIVFTTFHQSMGYEDFIEGIKPVPPGEVSENLQYEVKDGIFKRLSYDAAFTIAQQLEEPVEGYLKSFDLIYDAYIDSISDRLDKGELVSLISKNGNTLLIDSISEYGNVLVKHNEETRVYTVSKKRLSKLDAAFPNLEEVTNIYNSFRSVIGGSNASAYWAVLNDIRDQAPIKAEASIEAYDDEAKKSLVQSVPVKDFEKAMGKPFVLIIDEINRGNIAQIFGELITLIERDKRMGCNEGLRVSLPYSDDSFGVPHNVHIIGTMNTADRSVEALDTALRRRFSFKQLSPDASLLHPTVEGIDLELMLDQMNKRLTVLKDSDHTIGHAWLMENSAEKNVVWLQGVFRDKILPLLQEYFYGDYEKIGLVLGEPFFEEMKPVDSKIFARFKKGTNQANQYNQTWQYKLKLAEDLTEADFKAIYETASNTQSGLDQDE